MTEFGKIPGRTLRTLSEDAVRQALIDADLEADQIDSSFSPTPPTA